MWDSCKLVQNVFLKTICVGLQVVGIEVTKTAAEMDQNDLAEPTLSSHFD